MSVQFTANTQICGIDSNTAIDQKSFTITAKVYLDSDTAGAALSTDTTSMQYHELYWDSTANGGWKIGVNYRGTQATMGTTPVNEWVSIAMVFRANVSNLAEIRGHVKAASGAMLSATAANAQPVDTLNEIFISGGYPTSGASAWFRGKIADVKLWARPLSDAEVEAEFASQAPVSTTDLICANYFDGGDITNALSSNISNQAYANTWTAVDYAGVTRSNPIYSAAAPAYATAGVTLSGTVAMPSTVPSIGVDVVSFRADSVQNAATASVSYDTAPLNDRLLVACVGGFSLGTDVIISDNRNGVWTKRVFDKGVDAGSTTIVGCWTASVPSGSGPYVITATPVGDPGNFITLSVLEVTKHFPASPIDVVSLAVKGAGTTVTIDMPNTVSAKTLVLGVASWLGSNTVASTTGSNVEVFQKSGGSGLVISKRYVTSAGNYDPTFSLSETDSYVGIGLAITENQGTVGGGMPPVIRKKRQRNFKR